MTQVLPSMVHTKVQQTLSSTDVEVGINRANEDMIWIGEHLRVETLFKRYARLREEFGLQAIRLAFSIGISESSLSRIFNKHNKPNRSTLIALDVALNEWEKLFSVESEGVDESLYALRFLRPP